MRTQHGSHRPILVICDRGRIFALDNRCPHMGFPLERGSIEGGISTCHWHHARFDLESGCTFDLWADEYRPARSRCAMVTYDDPSRTDAAPVTSLGIKESRLAGRFDSNQNPTRPACRFPPPWSVEEQSGCYPLLDSRQTPRPRGCMIAGSDRALPIPRLDSRDDVGPFACSRLGR
jgi:nitrite reductase/ring-hydroxylating ferredoxin subunit